MNLFKVMLIYTVQTMCGLKKNNIRMMFFQVKHNLKHDVIMHVDKYTLITSFHCSLAQEILIRGPLCYEYRVKFHILIVNV